MFRFRGILGAAEAIDKMAIDDVVEKAEKASGSGESSPLEKKTTEKKAKKKGFLRKTFDFMYLTGAAVGATMLSTAFVGPLGFVVGGAFAGGGLAGSMAKGKKPAYDSITDFLKTYTSLNAVLAPMVWLGEATYPVVGGIGKKLAGKVGAVVAKTSYALTAYNAMFVAQFKAAHHLVDNYFNPIGITKAIKEDYSELAKRVRWGFAPAYTLAANGISNLCGVPVFALNAAPLGVYNGLNPIGGKK